MQVHLAYSVEFIIRRADRRSLRLSFLVAVPGGVTVGDGVAASKTPPDRVRGPRTPTGVVPARTKVQPMLVTPVENMAPQTAEAGGQESHSFLVCQRFSL